MSRTNRPKQFERYLESTGRDISAYVAKSPDVSGVIRLRDRDQRPTTPPQAISADIRKACHRKRTLIAALLSEVNDDERMAEALEARGE